MPRWLGRSKDKDKKQKESKVVADGKHVSRKASSSSLSPSHQITVYGADNKQHTSPNSSSGLMAAYRDSTSPTPSDSSQDLVTKLVPVKSNRSTIPRRDSGTKVAAHKAFYEDLSLQKLSNPGVRHSASPEKRKNEIPVDSGYSGSVTSNVTVTVASSNHNSYTQKGLLEFGSATSPSIPRRDFDSPCGHSIEVVKEKEFEGIDLPLPPLRMTPVRLREIDALRNMQSGGFGFILRKSYLPSPEEPDKTKLVHLIEPRPDYYGPLMTGDRIIEVNGEDMEDAPHEVVVEMIKASRDCVSLKVASMPELLELNARGALDNPQNNPLERSSVFRRSGKAKQGTGTLRRQGKIKNEFKAKTEDEVKMEREGLSKENVWVVHKAGFTQGTVVQDTPKKSSLSTHVSFFRVQSKELIRVELEHSGEILEVDDDDIEKANPSSLDKVEDLVNLVHLNESSALHVLRQRYGSSLIHTFAGRHLLVLNPLKPLSSYVDRVIDMFRGCRREDMPPHIFAMGQQAYRDMMVTRQDQSLILMGLSGSGKTFNTRYLLRYLTTVGQPEHGPVTNAKLDAVELLLHSFSSAATVLNPQATRCACLYSLNFDPSGTILSAAIQTFLLEKNRITQHTQGEGNFNIFYQLLAGADNQLTSDLMLDAMVETDDCNLYCEELDDPLREESAGYVWDLIQNCLEILGISEEEALGLWSLLAAIYHLGFAGVKKGAVRGTDNFLNPAAAQRAAAVLGVGHETLGQDIFTPPRGGAASRLQSTFTSSISAASPTQSDTTSISSSLFLTNVSGNRSAYLDGFVMGLYDQAFNALVMLINRSLQASSSSGATKTTRSTIHVLDTSGFQDRELAGARNGSSFDDLCMNYVQERLQMLFHDVTFTSEQDRYLQENINWMFSEVASSPLAVIDTIDRHMPQRRGMTVDFQTDRKGLLWILDEESVFPGASDGSFLDRLHMYHGGGNSEQAPLVKVIRDDNQFMIYHCQRRLPVLYDANEWLKKAREHPSFRVVVQTLSNSKRPSVACIFQGRGVAASATSLGNSQLKADTHRSLARTSSGGSTGTLHFPGSNSGIKKSSVCLQTKFRVDYLVDTLRKTKQWFICCILPQMPHKLPGALPSPDSALREQQTEGTPSYVDIDVPLVREQLRRVEVVKAARIYKQGYPEHISFDEFSRRYLALRPPGGGDSDLGKMDKKDEVELVLFSQSVDKNLYRVGLSQVFFRAGTLASLDRIREDKMHDTMVQFQARCRGWLGRKLFEKLELQDSAALVVQQNVRSYIEVRDWMWWKLFLKVKPLLAIWRAEEEIKDRDSKIDKLQQKFAALEAERDALKESEGNLDTKVTQLTARLEEIQSSANEASDMMEEEQAEKRELEEKLTETVAHEAELTRVNEQLHIQIAEMSILARIKQTDEGREEEQEESILEKYYEARRELETITQRITSEFEDQVESLESAKRSLEKKLVDSEGEKEDLHRTLAQTRKKAAKVASEMNDLKLHLETQQARNAELEKRQRKFDVDLNAAKDDSNSEVHAREKLAREMSTLQAEHGELKEKLKAMEEEKKRLGQEKEDLESELLSRSAMTTESELTSLKRIKRDMETKLEELEDELDEANMKVDSLQQTKARLELSQQTLKHQHMKELESREEDLEQVKATLSKKLKALTQQLEEVHEEKAAAIKARRDLEREMLDYQSKLGDPETEKKLKRQLKKYKALLEDTQEQLEHERDQRGNSASIRALKNQLEELQSSETAAVKNYKRLQGDMDELQIQYDDIARSKNELESRLNDVSRAKAELESRVEEDQDEIEELLEKHRSHISQTASLQTQLAEAQLQVEEMVDIKVNLESKIETLQGKLSEVEGGIDKHQHEATEHKVKELEQKLELERSSARRHESQISRLRNQLERLREEKAEDTSHKNTESFARTQKQIRELRGELQETERKEQEMAKKKRLADAQIEELEVQLQSTQADLKSAHKRIEQLYGALKTQEDYSGDEDARYDSRVDSMGNLSSDVSSYDDDESLYSSEDEDDIATISSRVRSSSLRGNGDIRDGVLDNDEAYEAARKARKERRRELNEMISSPAKSKSKKVVEDDNFEARKKARQERMKKLESDLGNNEDSSESSRKVKQERVKQLDNKEEDEFDASRKARQERLKKLEEEENKLEASRKARQERMRKLEGGEDEYETSRKSRQERTKKVDSEDDDFEASRKARQERVKKLEAEEDEFESSRRSRQERIRKLEEEEGKIEASSKARQERRGKFEEDERSVEDENLEERKKAKQKRLENSEVNAPKADNKARKTSSARKRYDDDDDDEDADLEQFLLKQRERMRNLDRDSDNDASPVKPNGKANGKANGLHSPKATKSREASAEPPASEEAETSKQRRKRQRRRTIEQLQSPEHKVNGVNL